jgi:hypothetical protein
MFNEIETQAIENFVGQAKIVSPERRTAVIVNMNKLIATGTCPFFKGTKISHDVMREAIRQIDAL